MPTYYVGPNGNDGNSGLTWALRKLTLNGAEDVPVVAGDTVYVGPGIYREQLTCDVSGGAGNEIVYIADVTGEHTDGVGGPVRITGSDNDLTITRTRCIYANVRHYRVFRGFWIDMFSMDGIYFNNSTHMTVEDCCIQIDNPNARGIYCNNVTTDVEISRCIFTGCRASIGVKFYDGTPVDDAGHLVKNCIFLSVAYAIQDDQIGGVDVRNCTFSGHVVGIRILTALSVGQTLIVNNCLFYYISDTAVWATVLGELIENFNAFWQNFTDRANVAVGGGSNSNPPFVSFPILHSGASQVSGYKMPSWWYGELSEWSLVRAIAGANEPPEDLRGIPRPTAASKNSWGAVQFHDAERDTTTVQGGSTASLALNDAGVYQIWAPVDGNQITASVYCYREANYAGVNPRMVIKQPGQADRTTTDVGAAGAWNQLTDTFTPAADPEWITIDLQSSNTAVAGNYAAYFDTLELSASPDTGEFETWLWDREMADWVVTAGAGAVSITPLRGGLGGG